MVAEARSTHSGSLRGVLVPALLVFAAVTWWASSNIDEPPRESLSSIADRVLPAQGRWSVAGSADRIADGDTGQAKKANEDSLGTYADGKYQFLFDKTSQAPEAAGRLRAALLTRERLAVAINTARQSSDVATRDAIPAQLAELAELDQKIGTLLPAGDLATFEVLKDSDVEQFQLNDYAGGVSNVAPLSDADRKAILYTKLTHRQRFRQVLTESRLMSGELSASERQYAFAEVSRALSASHDSYLQEVRQYLYNDEQFTLLSNYESTEYSAELEKLRGIAQGN